jgi:hypothetical protein
MQTKISINQPGFQAPLMDSSAAKRVLCSANSISVYDPSYTLLGSIPGAPRTLAINRQGTRVYALNQDGTLHTFDLSASPVSGSYPEIGSGSTVSVPASGPSAVVYLELTTDGSTLFLT